MAERLRSSSAPVLIEGETGCGKSVLARWFHERGARASRRFVDLNCAGLSRELLANELFGHSKGAFTGANADARGLFEAADEGTVFLDEIGDMDLVVQAQLLKVIEEKRFRRLGDTRDLRVDVRLIAATHRDLASAVSAREFRADLLYRINMHTVRLPPLRERGADVIVLAASLLRRLGMDSGRPDITLTADAEEAVLGYGWPGNIRELANVLERALLLADHNRLEAADLRLPSVGVGAPPAERRTLRQAATDHVRLVLASVHGDVGRAAGILGLSRSAVYERLKG